ncbi:MAG: hypothetical protein ACRDJB_04185, partial [Actinomycetota bacterium]
MGVDEALLLTAGEAAAVTVAVSELALERLGHVAGGVPQAHDVTSAVVHHSLYAGVAAQQR